MSRRTNRRFVQGTAIRLLLQALTSACADQAFTQNLELSGGRDRPDGRSSRDRRHCLHRMVHIVTKYLFSSGRMHLGYHQHANVLRIQRAFSAVKLALAWLRKHYEELKDNPPPKWSTRHPLSLADSGAFLAGQVAAHHLHWPAIAHRQALHPLGSIGGDFGSVGRRQTFRRVRRETASAHFRFGRSWGLGQRRGCRQVHRGVLQRRRCASDPRRGRFCACAACMCPCLRRSEDGRDGSCALCKGRMLGVPSRGTELPLTVYESVQSAVEVLHRVGFVFGDLRPSKHHVSP